MEVFINNQSVSVSNLATLSDVLLHQNFLDKKGIAAAVNNAVIPKSDWSNYRIEPADKITVIRASQGG